MQFLFTPMSGEMRFDMRYKRTTSFDGQKKTDVIPDFGHGKQTVITAAFFYSVTVASGACAIKPVII